jgi:hypothetical protein
MKQSDLSDHLNIIRFFRTDLYINTKVLMSNSNNFNTKLFNDVYSKIKIFRNIQERYELSVDDLNYQTNDKIDITDGEWKHIQKLLKYTKGKPATSLELKPIVVQMIKSIMTNNIVNNKQVRTNKIVQRIYTFNKDVLNHHLELNNYSNPDKHNYEPQYNTLLNIKAYESPANVPDEYSLLDGGLKDPFVD